MLVENPKGTEPPRDQMCTGGEGHHQVVQRTLMLQGACMKNREEEAGAARVPEEAGNHAHLRFLCPSNIS